ncbi:MAG: hypothetical protein MB54_03095 [marine actinobacterium MedAcidi-G2B]|nr:MAG: hypothetical protein MB54_03095 [marine actinobacterium MedAcidi-G2B]
MTGRFLSRLVSSESISAKSTISVFIFKATRLGSSPDEFDQAPVLISTFFASNCEPSTNFTEQ